jgi:hypothetical protein
METGSGTEAGTMKKERADESDDREASHAMVEALGKLRALGPGLTCAKCDRAWRHVMAGVQLCDGHAADAKVDRSVARQREARAAMRGR